MNIYIQVTQTYIYIHMCLCVYIINEKIKRGHEFDRKRGRNEGNKGGLRRRKENRNYVIIT